MKKINKFSLLLVTLVLVSVFSNLVSGALTASIVTPASSGTMVGNYTFNGSYTGFGDDAVNLINVSFYIASASLTGNTSWVLLGTNMTHNLTASGNYTSIEYDTSNLDDGTDYIVNMTVLNNTGGNLLAEDTNTVILIDNGVPGTPSSLSPSASSVDTDGIINFSATVTGYTTTACTLYFVDKYIGTSTSYTMAHTSNQCSYTLTNIPEESYEYYIQASDGTNTTNSASTSFGVDIPKGTKPGVILKDEPSSTGGRALSITSIDGDIAGIPTIVIIVAVIVVIVGIIIYKRK